MTVSGGGVSFGGGGENVLELVVGDGCTIW